MIRHQTVGGDADLGLGLGFSEDLFKRGVVSRFHEGPQSFHATIQDVIGEGSAAGRGRRDGTEWLGWPRNDRHFGVPQSSYFSAVIAPGLDATGTRYRTPNARRPSDRLPRYREPALPA